MSLDSAMTLLEVKAGTFQILSEVSTNIPMILARKQATGCLEMFSLFRFELHMAMFSQKNLMVYTGSYQPEILLFVCLSL